MGFLDKILGRTKKTTSDMTGNESMGQEGMQPEPEGMAEDRPEATEGEAQAEHEH